MLLFKFITMVEARRECEEKDLAEKSRTRRPQFAAFATTEVFLA